MYLELTPYKSQLLTSSERGNTFTFFVYFPKFFLNKAWKPSVEQNLKKFST